MNFEDQTILLVEDNEDDVFFFKRAYKHAQIPHPLQVVNDGQEATDYIMGNGRFADRTSFPLPILVLLDLKLPLKHGLEVLNSIRTEPATADACVVVMTSSAEELDLQRAQKLRAYAYLVKPPSHQMLKEVIAAVRARVDGGPGSAIPKIAGDLFENPAGMLGNNRLQ